MYKKIIFLLLLIGTVGCSTSHQDGPPLFSPLVSLASEPTPKLESYSRRGNHSYTVFGKRYAVMSSHVGYTAVGTASWYGKKFHKRLTSSGEPYDMFSITAAHKSLPIPSYARVTNLENKKSIVVRVNDRGPFHEDRLIDLSYAAAVKLGMANKGTAKVKIEAIDVKRT